MGRAPTFDKVKISAALPKCSTLRHYVPSSRYEGETPMTKAYWIATYRSVSNPDALTAYAKLSGPAVTQAGGRILVRGLPAHVYEAGLQQRTVVIEFDSVEQAMAAHDCTDYQEALAALANGAERDIRIVEGA